MFVCMCVLLAARVWQIALCGPHVHHLSRAQFSSELAQYNMHSYLVIHEHRLKKGIFILFKRLFVPLHPEYFIRFKS